MAEAVRACPIWCAVALLTVCSAAGGCTASRNPIFEWAPPPLVAGAAGATAAGMPEMVAGEGGKTVPPVAGAGGGIAGEPGTGVPMNDGITFEWTQKPPAMCSASNYVGTVACALDNNGLTVTRIDGTLVLDLVGPSESQELKVEQGTLTLLPDATNGMPLTATVTGSASCATSPKTFTGMIPQRDFTPDEIGVLQNVALVLLCATGTNSYTGAILGSIDADGSLSGTLSLTLGSCVCESQFKLRPQR